MIFNKWFIRSLKLWCHIFFFNFHLDKFLQKNIEKSQTSNQSTDSRPEILADETTTAREIGEEMLENETLTEKEETGEENLLISFDELRKISTEEEILSKTVSVKKEEEESSCYLYVDNR